jgi:hypothetical protein
MRIGRLSGAARSGEDDRRKIGCRTMKRQGVDKEPRNASRSAHDGQDDPLA